MQVAIACFEEVFSTLTMSPLGYKPSYNPVRRCISPWLISGSLYTVIVLCNIRFLVF